MLLLLLQVRQHSVGNVLLGLLLRHASRRSHAPARSMLNAGHHRRQPLHHAALHPLQALALLRQPSDNLLPALLHLARSSSLPVVRGVHSDLEAGGDAAVE